MVGVGYHLSNHGPGSLPVIGIGIHQNTHKLRHAQCGMGIVDMDSHLIGKVIKRSVGVQMLGDDALQGCGHQEVLLAQSQKLTLVVIVGGIQDLGDHHIRLL